MEPEYFYFTHYSVKSLYCSPNIYSFSIYSVTTLSSLIIYFFAHYVMSVSLDHFSVRSLSCSRVFFCKLYSVTSPLSYSEYSLFFLLLLIRVLSLSHKLISHSFSQYSVMSFSLVWVFFFILCLLLYAIFCNPVNLFFCYHLYQ